jgi:hypothetical protein
MQTYIANNLSWLENFSSAKTTTSSSTNNVAYGDIGAAGPAITLTTGTQIVMSVGAEFANNTAGDGAAVSFAVSGATTFNASSMEANGWGLYQFVGTVTPTMLTTSTFVVTGLTAGSNTFTLKYRAITGGVAIFQRRTIWGWALPSS